MKLSVSYVPCREKVTAGEQPCVLIKRHRPPERNQLFPQAAIYAGEWYTADKPIEAEKVSLSLTQHGNFVRLQLFPYLTVAKTPEVLIGTGAQIASLATAALRAIERREPKECHIAIGDVFDNGEQFQCWLGFAFEF